jgi:hypothetical protein
MGARHPANLLKSISGSSTASSRHPLAARFAQMAIARKSKNAQGGITGSYGVFQY